MSTNVLPLEYHIPQTLGSREARRAAVLLLILSVLSGLCVGVCFLSLSGKPEAAILHALVFGLTIATGVWSSVVMSKIEPPRGVGRYMPSLILDVIAAMGLLIIGAAPVMYSIYGGGSLQSIDEFLIGILGIAYLLLAITTARHVMQYRFLAGMCREINRPGIAKRLIALGWCKAIYEGLWLSCCAAALLLIATNVPDKDLLLTIAVAALVGAIGFSGVWIWMIIAHVKLLGLTRAA